MKRDGRKASLRCAIYTRVSTDNGIGAGVQLARQPTGSVGSLYQKPGPRRLETDPGSL